MTTDLAVFHRPVPDGAVGLEPDDQRLADLQQLVDQHEVLELLAQVGVLLAGKVYDVRVAVFHLWAAFEVDGLPGLGAVLDAARALLTSDLLGYGPKAKREAHASRRFAWLFSSISDSLEYNELRATETWKGWTANPFEAPFDALAGIDAAFGEGFEQARQPLTELTVRLRRLAKLAPSAQGRVPEAEPTPSLAVDDAAPEAAPLPPAHAPDLVELAVSPRFTELVDKLAAFRTLALRGDFERAAIVGDDVSRLLDQFDPRAYFPQLFSDFSQILSDHIDVIAGHWEARDSTTWRARAQLYQVDRRRFVDGK